MTPNKSPSTFPDTVSEFMDRGVDEVIDALDVGVLITGPDGIEGANQALREMFDVEVETMGDTEVFERVAPYDLTGRHIRKSEGATAVAMRTGEPVKDQVVGIRSESGHERWLSITAVPSVVEDSVVRVVTTFRDVTISKLATDALAANNDLYRGLAESMPIGIYRSDVSGTLLYVNPAWEGITGFPADTSVGMVMTDHIVPQDRDMVVTVFTEIFSTRKPGSCQYRFTRRDGDVIWLRVSGSPTFDPDTGKSDGFIGSIEDISGVVKARGDLMRLAQIVERTSDLVGTIDPETFNITYLNRSARLLLGLSRDQARMLHATDLYTPEAIEMFFESILPKLHTYGSWTGDLPIKGPDGTTLQLTQTITIQRNPDGSIREYSAIGRDTTDQQRMADELEYRATHDALTGLPNRALLLDRISVALAKADRDESLIALIFLDIDRFKPLNDTYGHAVGDKFLIEVAKRIDGTLRPGDTVARLGGDEFIVLIEGVRDEAHALKVARRITAVLESDSFDIDDVSVKTTVSGGIALSAGGPDEHADAVLRDADAAMYRAKESGRARLELFDEGMRRRASEHVELIEDLARGIREGQIEVYYQPLYNLTSGSIIGVEALARWNHPTRGLVFPDDFIPVAEESGLIVDLGLCVLEAACSQSVAWQDDLGHPPLQVHVNLSARQLNSILLAPQVAGILASTRMPGADLCLEITESTLMQNASKTIELLAELKKTGVTLAIDDFGTGYSSLAYLLRFPVDTLKIDRSFVDGLGPEVEDSVIVAAIISLAATLNLQVIAEGVETAEQLSHLRNLGCDFAQGYLFAKPISADEMTKLLIADT